MATTSPPAPAPTSADTAKTETMTPKYQKLHGRAFYESIGSPKFVLAPMVDQSEFAWRMLSRSFMTPTTSRDLVAYTPMLHARMFTETPKFRDNHFQPVRSGLASPPSSDPAPPPTKSETYLDGNPATDRPLFVQFCANNPDELLAAAEYVAPYCDAVDLNLGCPQGIARKGKYGAFLQEDQELIFRLINHLHLNLAVPVTAKIRVLETREKSLAYAQKVLSAGASILTVHGRQREQKGHKTGLADWTTIRYLRENLPAETVLFANGNILQHEDIERCIAETGVDGVMSAEGNLCDPSIFGTAPPVGEEGREYWRGRDGRGGWRMDAVMRRYMDILYTHVLEVAPPSRTPLFLPSDQREPSPAPASAVQPLVNGNEKRKAPSDETEQPAKKKQKREKREKTTNPNLLAMQPHLFHLLRSLVKKHHNVRDALAHSRAGDIAAFENVLQMVEVAVRQGLIDYEATNGRSVEDEWAAEDAKEGASAKGGDGEAAKADESSVETVRMCRRPWWVCQPYVRPLPAEALMKGSLTLSRKELDEMKAREEGQKSRTEAIEGKKTNGFVESEKTAEGEKVEIPREGLVCG